MVEDEFFKREMEQKMKALKNSVKKNVEEFKFHMKFPFDKKIASIITPNIKLTSLDSFDVIQERKRAKTSTILKMKSYNSNKLCHNFTTSIYDEVIEDKIEILSEKEEEKPLNDLDSLDGLSLLKSRKRSVSEEKNINQTFNIFNKSQVNQFYTNLNTSRSIYKRRNRQFSSSFEKKKNISCFTKKNSVLTALSTRKNKFLSLRKKSSVVLNNFITKNDNLEKLLNGRHGKVIKDLQGDNLISLDLSFAGWIIRLKRFSDYRNS